MEAKKDNRTIYERMADAMLDIEPVKKARENTQQKFKFRGVDDVFNMLQPILAKHGIFLKTASRDVEYLETSTNSGGKMRIYRLLLIVHFIGRNGDKLTTAMHGEGFDNGDKGLYKAYSNALKYVLFQAFAIPTDEIKDVENDAHEVQVPAKVDKQHEAYTKAVTNLYTTHSEKVGKEQPIWAEIKAALAAKDYAKVQQLGETIKNLATIPNTEANEEAK